MENNPLEKFIKTIKTGTRTEVKEAQKGVERFWHDVYIPKRKEGKRVFSVFLNEIKEFDKIKDIDHQAYFISVLKWPFFATGEEYFNEWENFILKQIQNPSGKIRQALIHASDYLIMDIAMDLDIDPRNDPKEKERMEINRQRFCNLIEKAEFLLGKYDNAGYRKYKYISSMPSGIYKSLQIFIVEHLLRSEYYEKIYKDWLKTTKGNGYVSKNIFFEESTFSDYISYHKSIDWQEVKNKESQFVSKSGKIFEREYPLEEKKKLIFILAHVGTNDCYKALKRYLENPDIELKRWAEIAFDECKNVLESDLREEDQVSVTVGAGKEGNKFRLYFVLSHHKKKDFSKEEMKIITQSASLAAMVLDFVLEDIFIKNNYALISAFHTADQAPATLIEKCIVACNQGENLVSDDYLVTNTHKPSEREIEDYIRYSAYSDELLK